MTSRKVLGKCPFKEVDTVSNSERDTNKPRHNEAEKSDSTQYQLKYPTEYRPGYDEPRFHCPFQLVSFSYTPDRVLEFTNSALKYYTTPPLGADLSYRYDHWIKRPEERGRLDGLLEACLHQNALIESKRANVISWRGVMTK